MAAEILSHRASAPALVHDDAEVFAKIVHARRATRHFAKTPLPGGIVERLVGLAQRAPSGYALQPWIAIVVTDRTLRKQLCRAAFDQAQITEAPATVVFAADSDVVRQLRPTIDRNVRAGHWDANYGENKIASVVKLRFAGGPLGILQPIKSALLRIVSFFRPTPGIPVGRAAFDGYVSKQTALAIQTFLLAAKAHGLDTCPMEGFDERWVRRVVGLPARFCIPAIVPIGYAADAPTTTSPRAPLEGILFRDRYEGRSEHGTP
jgi:nitroreductase